MIISEEKYKDKVIKLGARDICKLSDLTKEERDIYFSGYDCGGEDAVNLICMVLLLIGVFIIITLIIINP